MNYQVCIEKDLDITVDQVGQNSQLTKNIYYSWMGMKDWKSIGYNLRKLLQ